MPGIPLINAQSHGCPKSWNSKFSSSPGVIYSRNRSWCFPSPGNLRRGQMTSVWSTFSVKSRIWGCLWISVGIWSGISASHPYPGGSREGTPGSKELQIPCQPRIRDTELPNSAYSRHEERDSGSRSSGNGMGTPPGCLFLGEGIWGSDIYGIKWQRFLLFPEISTREWGSIQPLPWISRWDRLGIHSLRKNLDAARK